MKSIGPRESSLTASAIATSSGAQSTRPTAAPTTLTTRAVRSAAPWLRKPFAEDQHARPERLDGHLAGQALVELERVLDDDAAHARFEQRLQRQPVAPIGDRDDDDGRMHLLDDLRQRDRTGRATACARANPSRLRRSTMPATP